MWIFGLLALFGAVHAQTARENLAIKLSDKCSQDIVVCDEDMANACGNRATLQAEIPNTSVSKFLYKVCYSTGTMLACKIHITSGPQPSQGRYVHKYVDLTALGGGSSIIEAGKNRKSCFTNDLDFGGGVQSDEGTSGLISWHEKNCEQRGYFDAHFQGSDPFEKAKDAQDACQTSLGVNYDKWQPKIAVLVGDSLHIKVKAERFDSPGDRYVHIIVDNNSGAFTSCTSDNKRKSCA